MMPPPAQKKVSFADVAFKGRFKYLFILLIIIAIVSFAAGAIFRAKAPQNYSGTIEHDEFTIEVTDNTEQPVDILISHTYDLEVDYPYYVVQGDDYISYNLTIAGRGGEEVYKQRSSFEVPMTLKVDKTASTATWTGSAKHWADLLPGTYTVSIDSTAPLDYKVVQKAKSQSLSDGLLALGGASSLVLILLSFIVLKKRDAINRSKTVAMLSGLAPGGPQMGPAAPPAPLINYPVAPAPAQYNPPPQPPAPAAPQYYPPPPPPAPLYPDPAFAPAPNPYPGYWTGTAPVPDPAHRSSLEFVPGGFYRELICPNCGGMVRNQPVYGIVTCEHCGEPSRIY